MRTAQSRLIIAHRGGLYHRPENTMAAFEQSVRLGVPWVEADVRLCAGGVPVLCHDERIPYRSNGLISLRELSVDDLKESDVGGGEPIPLLEEAVRRFGSQLRFNLELKEIDTVEPVVRLTTAMGLADRTLFTSFIPEALQIARDVAPAILRGLLIDRLAGTLIDGRSAVNAASLLNCRYLLPEYRALDGDWVTAAHREGLGILVWTVNRPEVGARLIDMGVDGLISDRADIFLKYIEPQRNTENKE